MCFPRQRVNPSPTCFSPPRGFLEDGTVLASHLRQHLCSSCTLPSQLPAVARLPPGLLSAGSATVVQLCSRQGPELLRQGWELGWDLGPSAGELALAHRCLLHLYSSSGKPRSYKGLKTTVCRCEWGNYEQ